MKPGKVRALALCVFLHAGKILVQEGFDPVKGQKFYRPLGGAIEFGEPGSETVRRELREELDAGVDQVEYLGTVENIFTYNGQAGHEIVLIYDGRFTDPEMYTRLEIQGCEDGNPLKAVWLSLAGYHGVSAARQPPLYPTGLIDLIEAKRP